MILERLASMSTKILDLMRVPAEAHDINWLKQGLQAAAELEFATIPVYLCGMWSIQEQSGPAYERINSVVIEEMLHMGLACNMLTTLGGTPQINTQDVVPKYPGHLPGGVRPQLTVALTGLSEQVITDMYMQIEYPENGPVAFTLAETFTTIGEFYDALLAAFKKLPASDFVGTRQLTSSSLGLFAIKVLADAEKAINEIKQQGEGTSQSPFAVDFGGELAHYYRFAEIHHGRALVKTADGKFKYEGNPVPFPAVFPVAQVPPGGYPESQGFDQQFTALLNKLQSAWATGSQSDLSGAVRIMRLDLGDLARTLMQTPLPGGGGNFGPDFRLVA
jgi:Ferritin-like